MAPGKKDVKGEEISMGLIPVGKKETEERARNIVCVIRDETTIDWKSNKITLNLSDETAMVNFYKFIAEKANYVKGTFLVAFLKPSPDLKTDEEIVLDDNCDTTLGEVVGEKSQKTNNFVIKSKDGLDPVKKVQQPTESAEASSPETGISSLFDTETTFTKSYPSSNELRTVSFSKSESGFVGLINQAMTCYLNSLLQTLYMTPEFRNALYRWRFVGSDQEEAKCIPFQLQKLFLKLETSKKKAVETTDLTKSFGWDSSEAWQQHDVQELCRVMFDALEETLKNTDQADLINQLYQGKMKDYVKCLNCGQESARIDTYLDIPLPIRPFGSKESYGSIEEAFTAFTNPEVLDGNNQYSCEKCNSKQDAHKGLKFLTFPYLLTIQLKRFSYDYNTGQRIKLHDRVTFPEIIKLNEFIHEELPQKCATNSSSEEPPLQNETLVNGSFEEDQSNGTIENNVSSENDVDRSSEMYELFSIMIHSGNALGGHYYAYIKSFADEKWYCYNDQHVSEISKKEIEKSFGGLDTSARGYYSATYSSSTNAYMLMYRKKDVARNASFDDPSKWPDHLKSLRDQLDSEEDDEIHKRAKDRNVCKIRLFCTHPKTGKWIETKLHVEQSKTLREATEIAWKLLGIDNCIELERCRLVKYDDYYCSFERSFEGEEDKQIGPLLGGVKYSYAFDLLMETRDKEKKFPVYDIGGTTVKIYNVNLKTMEVEEPFTLHAKSSYTLVDLKTAIEEEFHLPTQCIRIAVGKDYHDFRMLTESKKTLRAEGFYKSAKVFIEISGGPDFKKNLAESDFAKVLDRYSNTIRLIVVLPFTDEQTKKNKEIIVKVDKRNKLAELKKQLKDYVGVESDNFRVYRVYSNDQEFETTRLNDQLTAYTDETKIVIKLGRALQPGETRIKLYLLRPNMDEHTKFLMETVISEGVKVSDLKNDIILQLKKTFDIEETAERMRLRKKSWKSPSTIYTDESIFEKDIKVTVNAEFFVEIVDEKLQLENLQILSVYVKRWRPSKHVIDDFGEVLLKSGTIEEFKEKLSEISDLPVEKIVIAKGKGFFPYESSVFDIERELDWNPDITKLGDYPLAIVDDGSVIYYKDKDEKPGELTEQERKEIKEKERKRMQKNITSSTHSRKEKALKIYTNKR